MTVTLFFFFLKKIAVMGRAFRARARAACLKPRTSMATEYDEPCRAVSLTVPGQLTHGPDRVGPD